MKTGGLESTSFAGSGSPSIPLALSRRDLRRPSNKYFPGEFRAAGRPALTLPEAREIDRRVAGALDNRPRRTSRPRRVSALGAGGLKRPSQLPRMQFVALR